MSTKPVAVITGATSGLGKEYAEQLAMQGYDLLLVARRIELLEATKSELESKCNVSVDVMKADLSDPQQLLKLEEKIAQIENLDILVNNAGYGVEGKYPVENIDEECKMIQVHDIAPTRLCQAALGPMMRRKSGKIINVSSVAAFLYGTGCAQYAATKAHLLTFSKCLNLDVRSAGIRVQALCPGLVRTGFHSSETMKNLEDKYKNIPDFIWLKCSNVVRDSLKNIMKKRHSVVFVPSLRYKVFLAILTCPLWSWLPEKIYEYRSTTK